MEKISVKVQGSILNIRVNNRIVLALEPKRDTTFTAFIGGKKDKAISLYDGQELSASFSEGKVRITVTKTKVTIQHRATLLYVIPVKESWVKDKLGVIF